MSDAFEAWWTEFPGAHTTEEKQVARAAWDAATEAERARAYYVGQKARDAARARIRELTECSYCDHVYEHGRIAAEVEAHETVCRFSPLRQAIARVRELERAVDLVVCVGCDSALGAPPKLLPGGFPCPVCAEARAVLGK